jgi:dihydroflavonol-4-reductase
VAKAVAGVDGVFHLAGRVSRNPADAAALYDLHVGGTRNVCEAARAQGRPRIVVASSSGTIAAGRTPVMHTEESPYVVELAGRWPYYLSKIYQEKLALAYHRDHQLPVVILNPSLLLGPGDERLSSIGDVLLFLQGHFLNIPSGGLNFVDARDAAAALVRAMEKGASGRRYLIGGHNMTIREFFALLERVSGVRGPRWELPESWARSGAALLRKLAGAAGSRYPVEDETIEMGYRFWYCDSRRARQELGFIPRPAEETLRDTIAYLRRRVGALVP